PGVHGRHNRIVAPDSSYTLAAVLATGDLQRLYSGFFFSSRRRHTRFSRDWSSDVCSSDLHERRVRTHTPGVQTARNRSATALQRSEERRVGKECRAGGAAHPTNERAGWRVQRFRERHLYFGGGHAVARDAESGERAGGGDP